MKAFRDYVLSEAGQAAMAKLRDDNRRSIEVISECIIGLRPFFIENAVRSFRAGEGELLPVQPTTQSAIPARSQLIKPENLKANQGGLLPTVADDFSYEIMFRGKILNESELLGRAADLVAHVENRLRDMASKKLRNAAGPKWFRQRVDEAIVERTKRNMKGDLDRGSGDFRQIAYTTLGELKQIIVRPNNWKECFERVFGDQLSFEMHMNRLIFVRNQPAHSRAVGHVEFAELHAVSKRLVRLVEEDGSKRRSFDLLWEIEG